MEKLDDRFAIAYDNEGEEVNDVKINGYGYKKNSTVIKSRKNFCRLDWVQWKQELDPLFPETYLYFLNDYSLDINVDLNRKVVKVEMLIDGMPFMGNEQCYISNSVICGIIIPGGDHREKIKEWWIETKGLSESYSS